jgi:hypothetical protein
MAAADPNIVLYNPSGAELRLTAAEWSALLATARANGWEERGTVAPPLRFDEDGRAVREDRWTGAYEEPRGQMIRRVDARAMAEALDGLPQFAHFVRFAGDGLLITEASRPARARVIRMEVPAHQYAWRR